jgi:hypothetical protein
MCRKNYKNHLRSNYYDWLIDYLPFYVPLKNISLIWGHHHCWWCQGLQNLGLCSAPRAFEQGGIFIVPHLLWHGTSVFPVSSEGPPNSVASYDTHGDVGRPILNRILNDYVACMYICSCTLFSKYFRHYGPWKYNKRPKGHIAHLSNIG